MKNKHIILVAGMALFGAILGYLYYRYIGCLTGTCPIKSNPYSMTLFCLVMGGLIGSLFIPTPKK